MRVCAKCGHERRDSEFVWDDGILLGESKRCKGCRLSCSDCKRNGKGRVVARCEKHAAEWQGPVRPEFRYRVRSHAIHRFVERVRPGLSMSAALFEMLHLAQDALETLEPPAWLEPSRARSSRFHRGYLLVSDDVVFALAEYGERGIMVSTVMMKHGGQS